jgi:type II secretory pathway component PulF
VSVFHYLVKNDEGSRSEGDIRAESMDLAIQKLTSNGQIVISFNEVDSTFDFLGRFLDEINLTFE